MLEQLGKDIADLFEDVEFIGIFQGEGHLPPVCTFNCTRTGATFCGNSYEDIQKRLDFIRENYKPIAEEKA